MSGDLEAWDLGGMPLAQARVHDGVPPLAVVVTPDPRVAEFAVPLLARVVVAVCEPGYFVIDRLLVPAEGQESGHFEPLANFPSAPVIMVDVACAQRPDLATWFGDRRVHGADVILFAGTSPIDYARTRVLADYYGPTQVLHMEPATWPECRDVLHAAFRRATS